MHNEHSTSVTELLFQIKPLNFRELSLTLIIAAKHCWELLCPRETKRINFERADDIFLCVGCTWGSPSNLETAYQKKVDFLAIP